MKNIITKILALCIICTSLSFSGCAGNDKKSLVVWSHLTDNETNELRSLADKWSKENNITVKVMSDRGDTRAFIAADKAKMGPDIEFGISHIKLQKLQKEGLLAELPSTIDSSLYVDTAVETTKFSGKLYALPINFTTYAVYYNTDKIKNPPLSYEELIEYGQKYGFEYDATDIFQSYSILSATNGYIFGKNSLGSYNVKDIGLNNDNSILAYKDIQDLFIKYKLMPSDIDGIKARKDFQAGKTALYIGGPYDMPEFDKSNVHYKVATFPMYNGTQMKTLLNVNTAFVNETSNNKETSFKLLKYLVDEIQVKEYKITDNIPSVKAIIQKPELKSNENLNAFMEQAIKASDPIPNVAEIQALQDSRKILSSLVSGEITPKACGDQIVDSINKFIKEEDKTH